MGKKRRARERAARCAAELSGQDAVTAAVASALAPIAEGIARRDATLKGQQAMLTKIARQG